MMVLKFKQRGTNDLKKVMIYGNDGTGKSTFAETYCHENNLHPFVIDIDDTNYTNLPILDLDFGSDIKTYQNIKNAVAEISKTPDFDTIIIDGVTSLLEMLVSKAKGLKKYSDRAERFQDILRSLLSSGKHLIFIGQADMEVIYNEEFQSSKMVIKINSLVNEKYLCYKKKDTYGHEVVKFRTLEKGPESPTPNVPQEKQKVAPKKEVPKDTFVTAAEVGEPRIEDDPVHNTCMEIKKMLEREGKLVTKQSMKAKVIRLVQDEMLPPENKPVLIEYINLNCPEALQGDDF